MLFCVVVYFKIMHKIEKLKHDFFFCQNLVTIDLIRQSCQKIHNKNLNAVIGEKTIKI